MKRQLKLQQLKAQVAQLESQIETIEDSLRRSNKRRAQKAFRKRLAKDRMFRATMKLICQIESQMFQPIDISKHYVLRNWSLL